MTTTTGCTGHEHDAELASEVTGLLLDEAVERVRVATWSLLAANPEGWITVESPTNPKSGLVVREWQVAEAMRRNALRTWLQVAGSRP